MFKQFVSILLIFTVNILFLGHAVIPHHHHNGIPHFVFSASEHHHDIEEHDSDCCCSHSSSEKEETCQLEKDLDVISESKKNIFSITDYDSDNYSNIHQAILFSFSYDSYLLDEDDKTTNPPYLISYSSIDADQIHGLRAPPIV